MSRPDDGTDSCACYKMAGEWGRSGFHWRRMNRRECFRKMEREDTTPREGEPVCIRGLSEEECAEAGGCTYQGQEQAFARCPAWLAEVKRELRQRAEREAAG